MENETKETVEAFKNSFFYGSRSDLNFKFLANVTDAEAGEFFQGLLTVASDVTDDGNSVALADYIIAWQKRAYASEGRYQYDDGAFEPLKKPLAESNVALITSSGHFVDGDDPEPLGIKNMSHAEAQARIQEFLREEPKLSYIPADTPLDQLRIIHGGYPVRSAENDANVALPISHMRDLVGEGVIGNFAGAYSFVGACAQTRLLRKSGPQWVERLQSENVEVAVLAPV